MIVLEIIGGTVLVVLTVAALVYFYFRLKFGKYLNTESSDLEPLTIHINEDISPDWLNLDIPNSLVCELEAIGYLRGNPYSIYEIDGCLLQHLYQGLYSAVVYSHPIAGFWIDVVVEDDCGKQYTFTSAPMGDGLEERPDSEKNFSPKSSANELHSSAQRLVESGTKNFKNLSAVDFRQYFEESYRKDMAWKNRKGGISFKEFQNVEQQAPFRAKKSKIEEAFKQLKLDEINQWHQVALDDYYKENNILEEEWYDLEYKLFIVPFRTHAHAFLEYLVEQNYLKESDASKLQDVYTIDSDIPELFQSINNRFSPELRSNLVKEVAFPLQLGIYKTSERLSI